MSENNNKQSNLHKTNWDVYVILDPCFLPAGKQLVDLARETLKGGAGVIQLRDKIRPTNEVLSTCRELLYLCQEFNALFIVNDRLDIALACGADGVHLGPHDLPISDARRIAPDLIIGGSAGTRERAEALVGHGADYLGIGAIFEARDSKPDASAPRGCEVLHEVRSHLSVPIVAIGGITNANAYQAIEAGANGVAVIREVMTAPCPQEATRRLKQAISKR